MRFFLLTGAAGLALLTSSAAFADEGMWLPRQTPGIGDQLKAAGLQLDPAQLGNLKNPPWNAIVSLGGCSAAFISDQGLVPTNHHCVYGSIQYNSAEGRDYLTDGFLAQTLGDELPAAPGTRIYVIEDLRDVTKDMNKGITSKLSGLARFDKIDANRKALIAACEKQPNRRCDVRPYFGGATYYLQQQLEIKDVRLVYAPAGGIGNFGGDTDNWMWPRHTGDFGFYRAYVAPDGSSALYSKDNVPYRPKAWLKIAPEGVKENDFVMVAGFPGTTTRLVTAEEAKFNFATLYPVQQQMLNDYSETIEKATAGSEDGRIKYASTLASVDNYKKKYLGEMAGADRINLAARKDAQEAEYRAWIAADAKRQRAYDPAALDALVKEANGAALDTVRTGAISRAQLLAAARTLYRWSKEQQKPDAAREAGYQDRDRLGMEQRLTQIERRYLAPVDRAVFEQALTEYRKADPAARDAAFEAKLTQIGMDRLYADTKLADTPTRLAWLGRSPAEFEASDDPFIQLAVALYPGDMEREKKSKDRSGRIQAARSAYMKGMLEFADSQGRTLYPDANGSLRFTYGNVKGRAVDGQIWTPFTTAEGLAAKHTGKGEFDAPLKALDLIKAKDYGRWVAPELGTLPVDFLSTVDITNGNSGSSTLNAKGEFVGLAFDGTIDGVIADWAFDPAINRAIHVDSRFMFWTMEKVDGAQRLLDEMGVR